MVLSNSDGCVIARSNEAEALGIAVGAPWHLHCDSRPLRPIGASAGWWSAASKSFPRQAAV